MRAEQGSGSACICCGADAWTPLWQVLRRCGGCGFIRADLELTHEEARRLYQADYFRGQEYGDYLADRAAHVRNFEHRFRMMSRVAPEVRSLFEVGCAYGFWLDCCTRHGVRSEERRVGKE